MTVEGTENPERSVKTPPASEGQKPKPEAVAGVGKPALSAAEKDADQEARKKQRQAEKREARMRALVAQQLASMPAADPQASSRAARELRRKRLRGLALRLLLWVGIPLACASVYYGLLAQEQYESTTILLVRGEHTEQRVAALREYLGSRDMLRELEANDHFSQHFSRSSDPFVRLRERAGSEKVYQLFRDRIQIDTGASGLVTVSIRAFSAAQAERFLLTAIRSSGSALGRIYGQTAAGDLSVVAQPSRPTEASYPEPVKAILSVGVVCLLLFGVGSLLVSAIREHGHF